MNTTAGSFSLLKSVVPEDAGVIKKLRAAGAIILGLSNSGVQIKKGFLHTVHFHFKAKLISPNGPTSEGISHQAGLGVVDNLQTPTSPTRTRAARPRAQV